MSRAMISMQSGLKQAFVPLFIMRHIRQVTNPRQPCHQTPWGSGGARLNTSLITLDDPHHTSRHKIIAAVIPIFPAYHLANAMMTSGLRTKMFSPSEAVRLSSGSSLPT